MNKDFLFSSIGEIDERFIAEGDEIFSIKKLPVKRRKLGRTLLIAAVITGLLTATAYAAGLFNLNSARMKTGEKLSADNFLSEGEHISLNGAEGTPEYEANREWVSFCLEYQEQKRAESGGEPWISEDTSWTEAYSQYGKFYQFYGLYDNIMADKLIEIADKHSLRIHTEEFTTDGGNDFLLFAGIEDCVTAAPEDYPWGYFFEDGSFAMDVGYVGGDIGYSLLKNLYGTIPTMSLNMNKGDLDAVAERSYTSSGGAAVCISSFPTAEDGRHSVCISYAGTNSQVMAFTCIAGGEAEENAFADQFDFAGIDTAHADVEGFKAKYCAQPTVAQQPAGALTPEILREAAEYKAAKEFQEYYVNHMGGYGFECFYSVVGHPYGMFPEERCVVPFNGLISYGDAAVENKIVELCEKYSLRYPEYEEFIKGTEAYPYCWNGRPVDAGCRLLADESELWTLIDQQQFTKELYYMSNAYDTGAFELCTKYGQIEYIPKGTFFCLLNDFTTFEEGESWMYESKCGVTVCCIAKGSGKYAGGQIIYESSEGYFIYQVNCTADKQVYYIQAAADTIDFTKIK